MSREITALGQHTLPFNDKKALMLEISNRFQANVFIGFLGCYGLVKNDLPSFKSSGLINPVEDAYSCELYLLDELHFSESANQFTLIYEEYEYQWLYKKYGERAGYQKEFIYSWSNNPIENNKIINDFINDFKIVNFYYESIFGYLSHESAEVGLDKYFTDWINFFQLLTRTEYKYPIDFYKSLLNYRNKNRQTLQKLGGNCIYYYDNQGKNIGGATQENVLKMSWHQIENSFNTSELKKYQINLCEVLTNPDYLNHIQDITKNNFHDYSVFYDDFRELTWEDIIKP